MRTYMNETWNILEENKTIKREIEKKYKEQIKGRDLEKVADASWRGLPERVSPERPRGLAADRVRPAVTKQRLAKRHGLL